MRPLTSVLLLGFLVCSMLLGCHSENARFKASGLYAVKDGKDKFKIAKVLVADKDIVHIRLYKNTFSNRPTTVDPAELSLGSIKDKDGFGMGHLPLGVEAFMAWDPVLLMEAPVTAEELEGYKMWKESGGGAFK